MRNGLRTVICFICLSAGATAQTLSPATNPASAGYFTGGGKSLSWTMGETFNTTLLSGTKMLTQGEQQPFLFLKILNLKEFIQGFYVGSGQMRPVLYSNSLSTDPTACDSITVELHSATSPYAMITSAKALLHTNGSADVRFPIGVLNNSYYIVARHRNTLETWSKVPVTFNDAVAKFDFTTP